MIKIIEKGQKTFTRTCDRCGCKFQYDLEDLCGLDYIECPCRYTSLTHIGPNTNKIDLNKNNKIDWDNLKKYITPCKVEVGDGNYDYVTTTGTDPTYKVKANNITKQTVLKGGDPNATIYANKLHNDVKKLVFGDRRIGV